MGKERTAKLEKQKKARKGSTSSSAPPPRWIQGDWLPSKVTEQQVLELIADGLISKWGWRLPEAGDV